tara:strand:+ start:1747 stop:2409 length:663 start_codon:yes stop_codon:yes gene_type:complete
MKINLIILFFALSICSDYSNRYYQSMDKGIQMFESSESEEDLLKTSNYFYRISQVIKTDWLSSYYYSLCNTKISMYQDDPDIKEEYLDKAFKILSPFDSLGVNNIDSLAMSEIYTLKAMIYVGKIFINPMVNGMKYGPLSGQSIDKAIALYPQNPRPYYLNGQSKFYTPSAFGGGVDKALPLLKESLEFYKNFKAKKYWPNWGMEDCEILYNKALNDNKN